MEAMPNRAPQKAYILQPGRQGRKYRQKRLAFCSQLAPKTNTLVHVSGGYLFHQRSNPCTGSWRRRWATVWWPWGSRWPPGSWWRSWVASAASCCWKEMFLSGFPPGTVCLPLLLRGCHWLLFFLSPPWTVACDLPCPCCCAASCVWVSHHFNDLSVSHLEQINWPLKPTQPWLPER